MRFHVGLFLNSPTPLLDYGLITSNVTLTTALFVTDHSCALSGAALLCNLATTFMVNWRVKADLPRDKLQGLGFPVYDSGRIFSAALMTIAGCFPALFICLSTWFTSEFCWWIAATTLVVDLYVLLETLEGGHDRIRIAEKKIKDGFVWRDNTWKAPVVKKDT
jgi:hypothetical protein